MPTPTDWIKAGTTTDAPVTSSTPAAAEPASAPPSPTASATAAPASPSPAAPTASTAPAATATTAPAAASAGEAASNAAATAAAAGATPAQQVAAAEQAADAFITGRVGNSEFKIPRNLELPWKRGTETGFAPIEEIQKSSMLERDYRIKTARDAEARRQFELERRTLVAQVEEERKLLAEERERQQKALGSADDQAQYEAYLDRYRNDPYFKKQVDDAREGRVRIAVDNAVDTFHAEEALVSEANAVAAAVREIGARYPGINPDEVMRQYARDLQSSDVPLSRDQIESYYTREKETRDRVAAPFVSQIDSMKAEIAKLAEQLKAASHNATTREAMARTQNPIGAPVGGAPAAVAPASTHLKSTTFPERSREWARAR